MIKLNNQKQCFACGRKRHLNALLFDLNTLKSYCKFPDLCNSNHPKNKGIQVQFATHDVLDSALKEKYGIMIYQDMEKVMGKTTSFQITPAAGMMVFKFMQENGLDSKNKALNAILDIFMEKHDFLDDIPLQSVELSSVKCNFTKPKEVKPEPKPEPEKTVIEEDDDFEFEI